MRGPAAATLPAFLAAFLATALPGCREVIEYDDGPPDGTGVPIVWERTAGPDGEAILALRADPFGVLYAGSESGRLYRTVTDGSDWTPVPLPWSGGAITAVVVDPLRRIFVANDVHGICESIDGGASWARINAGLEDTAIYALAYLPGGVLAAGSARGDLSVIGGTSSTWVRVSSLARPVSSILALSSQEVFVAAWGTGIYRFRNSWSEVAEADAGLLDPYVNVLHAGAGGYLYAGTRSTGVFRSNPDEVFWQASGSGSISREVIALRTSGFNEVFAGTGTGVYLSVDQGLRWTKLDGGIGTREVRALAINENARVFAGTVDGVWRSVRLSGRTAAVAGGSGVPEGTDQVRFLPR